MIPVMRRILAVVAALLAVAGCVGGPVVSDFAPAASQLTAEQVMAEFAKHVPTETRGGHRHQ